MFLLTLSSLRCPCATFSIKSLTDAMSVFNSVIPARLTAQAATPAYTLFVQLPKMVEISLKALQLHNGLCYIPGENNA